MRVLIFVFALTVCKFAAINSVDCKHACAEAGVREYSAEKCMCNPPVKK